MSDYDDLFKSDVSNSTKPTPSSLPPEPDLSIDELTREYKVNLRLVLIYIGIMLLASIFQFVYFRAQYPKSDEINQAIEVVESPEVVISASGDLDYPYQMTFTGSFKNIWDRALPKIWVEYDFVDEQGKKIYSVTIDSDQIESGAEFTFSEIELSATNYPDWKISYGLDESSFYYVILYFSQLAITALLFLLIDQWSLKRDWHLFRKKWQSGIGQIFTGLILLYVVSILSQAFLIYVLRVESGSENEQAIASMFSNNPLALFMLFLLLCVFTPLVEELVYRKVIYRFMDRRFGSTVAIISSGLIFGLMHVINYGDFLQAIPYVLMGMVFGWVYHRSKKNIMVTTGMHFLNNLITFLIYFIAVLSQ
ncbi:MAG: lysostaphin resistance A-like protein [Candidatus Izemoplasmatales bacterium]|nr:lysostaphin resistance A-like protein [Candidatus Izemoplasmatales bacterium]